MANIYKSKFTGEQIDTTVAVISDNKPETSGQILMSTGGGSVWTLNNKMVMYIHKIETTNHVLYVLCQQNYEFTINTKFLFRSFINSLSHGKWINISKAWNKVYVYDLAVGIADSNGMYTSYIDSPTATAHGNGISYYDNNGNEVVILTNDLLVDSFVKDTITAVYSDGSRV